MKTKPLPPFLHENVIDRDLVIKMLTFENEYGRGAGQNIYNIFTKHDLQPQKTINRHVLNHFGFDSSDESVNMYRTIFKTYYRSASNYDKEVLDCVY